jgi:hypothetical protein
MTHSCSCHNKKESNTTRTITNILVHDFVSNKKTTIVDLTCIKQLVHDLCLKVASHRRKRKHRESYLDKLILRQLNHSSTFRKKHG